MQLAAVIRHFIVFGWAGAAALGSRHDSLCCADFNLEARGGRRALARFEALSPEARGGRRALARFEASSPAARGGRRALARSAEGDTLVFVWWNLQNLFDTVANSGPRDRDFLPNGPYKWDSKRYYGKLYAVGRGLAAAAGGRIPDAVGVCEVENADVLDDLERRWPPEWRLWRLHRDSPDERGIDVAVWYNTERLRVDSVAWIHPAQDHPTREAIWVRWITPRFDTLTWIWAHLPSQRAPTPSARAEAMKSVLSQAPNCPDGIIGDLNEGPNGPLGATLKGAGMRHVAWPIYSGSFAYRGRLEALDGVWVRESSAFKVSTRVVPLGLTRSARHGYQIRGSFEGMRYRGGASDHLPVCITVEVK